MIHTVTKLFNVEGQNLCLKTAAGISPSRKPTQVLTNKRLIKHTTLKFNLVYMRWIIALFILFFNLKTSAGQANFQRLKGNWISDFKDFIIISDSINYNNYVSDTWQNVEQFNIQITDDTLTFNINLTFKNDTWQHLKVFQFLIITSNDTHLIIKPLNQQAISFFSHFAEAGKVSFTRQEYVNDKTLQFNKLIYANEYCKIGCGGYVQCIIDSSRAISLYLDCIGKNGLRDTNWSGKYTGFLDTFTYNKLITHLQTSQLKETTIKNGKTYSHRNIIRLNIWFNGQYKEFDSFVHPLSLKRLDDFLCNLYNLRESLVRE